MKIVENASVHFYSLNFYVKQNNVQYNYVVNYNCYIIEWFVKNTVR